MFAYLVIQTSSELKIVQYDIYHSFYRKRTNWGWDLPRIVPLVDDSKLANVVLTCKNCVNAVVCVVVSVQNTCKWHSIPSPINKHWTTSSRGFSRTFGSHQLCRQSRAGLSLEEREAGLGNPRGVGARFSWWRRLPTWMLPAPSPPDPKASYDAHVGWGSASKPETNNKTIKMKTINIGCVVWVP